ncbi:putative epoxide hydrolase [Xylariales sp. PMI_506]|nr:putative epoxide hydrolase [Xylariales sp. PMI_506]
MHYYNLPTRQQFQTSRNYTYSYIHIPPQDQRPTLLMIHGWPSHIDDWIYQIRHFEARGYGLLVPDMLGYGHSSSPIDDKAYCLRALCEDLTELIDSVANRPQHGKNGGAGRGNKEKKKEIETRPAMVVGVGHDWGATILSCLAAYHPKRLLAAVFLGIGPAAPGGGPASAFDLDAINAATRAQMGREQLGYIAWVARDPEAPGVMEAHAESVMDVLFAADPTSWELHFHPLGGLKRFVEAGRRQDVGAWFPEPLRRRHLETFGRAGGHLGPSRYYRVLDQNLSAAEGQWELAADFQLAVPALLVVPRKVADMHKQILSTWVPRFTTITVDSGHWVHMERSDETNRAIDDLLGRL